MKKCNACKKTSNDMYIFSLPSTSGLMFGVFDRLNFRKTQVVDKWFCAKCLTKYADSICKSL